jgi:uncharacterized radical SAM protein YgiQ
VDHGDYLLLLKKLRNLPNVKKVFVRSGIRYDYLLMDNKAKEFMFELAKHHISGHLKVAPEHVSENVLNLMGKPSFRVFERFYKMFEEVNRKLGKKQYLVPYFISSHPGSGLREAIELALKMRDMKIASEQVQDFYPTPGTLSTCMYVTGLDPRTMKPVYIPRGEEKRMQRALLQYHMNKNHALVRKALEKAGREDLIGFGGNCLVPPQKDESKHKSANKPHTQTNYGKKSKRGKKRF